MNNNNEGVYIPSVDGKDIYISNLLDKKNGFTLKMKDGKPNLRRYKNVFDFSLDLIELRKIAKSEFWGKKDKFSFMDKGKEYCPNVINLNFKYAIKEFNKIYTVHNNKRYEMWIAYGYDREDLKFNDCVAKSGDEIVGVICGKEIVRKHEIKGFKCSAKENKDGSISLMYEKKDYNKTIKNVKQIREELYKDGFICDGEKYIRFKRSSGSARVGKMFIY